MFRTVSPPLDDDANSVAAATTPSLGKFLLAGREQTTRSSSSQSSQLWRVDLLWPLLFAPLNI